MPCVFFFLLTKLVLCWTEWFWTVFWYRCVATTLLSAADCDAKISIQVFFFLKSIRKDNRDSKTQKEGDKVEKKEENTLHNWSLPGLRTKLNLKDFFNPHWPLNWKRNALTCILCKLNSALAFTLLHKGQVRLEASSRWWDLPEGEHLCLWGGRKEEQGGKVLHNLSWPSSRSFRIHWSIFAFFF